MYLQVHLICMPPGKDNICSQSSQYHFVNEYLYKPVNLEEHQHKPNVTLRYSERYFPDRYYQHEYSQDEEERNPNQPVSILILYLYYYHLHLFFIAAELKNKCVSLMQSYIIIDILHFHKITYR